MALWGEGTCSQCGRKYQGDISECPKICGSCRRKLEDNKIRNIMERTGCNREMAEYLRERELASKQNIMR